MATEFLTDAWFESVEALAKAAPEPPAAMQGVDINVRITTDGAPDVETHLSSGLFGRGLVPGAPTTVTVPRDVAKKLFIDGNPQAAMQAFMNGKISVEGDVSRVMALQGGALSPEREAFNDRLRDLTL